MRNCVLHIGMSKTGTSSIQVFMRENKKLLRQQGVYPLFAPRVLPACVLSPDVTMPIFRSLNLRTLDEIEEYQYNQRERIVTNASCADTTIISSEWLCGFDSQQIKSVFDFLSSIFDNFSVVVYFRRQDRYAVSLYGLRLITGEVVDSVFDLTSAYKRRLDYLSVAERWAATFGKESFCPRIFSGSDFVEGSLYKDFLVACGVEWNNKFVIPNNVNESIDPVGQEFLRRYNAGEPDFINGLSSKSREDVVSFLRKNYKGKGKVPTKEEAVEFMDAYNKINNEVREKFFPNKVSLFDDGFDEYPVSGGESNPVFESDIQVVFDRLKNQE